MNETQLEKLFSSGILIDENVKSAEINDVDWLIVQLKSANITFLDQKTLHDIYKETVVSQDTYIEITKNYKGGTSASKPADWVIYFNDRFNRLKNLLLNKGISGIMSISQVKEMPIGSDVKFIAMISDISISPIKKFTIIEVEDTTSSYKVISPTAEPDLLPDQVVIITGKKSKDAIFAKSIIFPDIQVKENEPVAIEDAFVLFLSDIHIGSKLFAREAFEKFITWISGKTNEYSEIAGAVKFIVIIGDLVDGIGVYPDQEKELSLTDLKSQYSELYKLLKNVPKNIKILISQGNHDATHIAEPQPGLDPIFGEELYKLENAVFLSNPYQVNLVVGGHKTNLLGYHGFSITYYVNNIDRYNKMTVEDVASIMRLQLKSRHLAPTHGSAQIVPLTQDYLVIDETPDIYAAGHIHKALISKYKETILVNASCWQYQTLYQKKYGINPEVAKVPIINLKNKEFMMLDFLGEKVQIYKKGIKT
jgi:DNA polymerase II small subunit